MSPADRQREILAVLQSARQVDVASLAQRFGVSGMTIRRDLAELDHAGQLHRVHGGAVLPRPPAYGSRAAAMTVEKARIAKVVADLVRDDQALGIDSGTTCHAVAAEVSSRTDLTVVTNALHAAVEFRDTPNRVVVLGGVMTRELTLVNAGATDAVPRVHLDTLVLGCGGISAERGLTYFDPAEVDVRRSLLVVADRVIVAADHTKLGRKTAIVLGGLDVIDMIVTDRPPPLPLSRACEVAGVQVTVAP
ncbi:DeoR/GlpR family DNA-binding transcription regulator [Pseudonocardia sp. MH-G8]|uniref:DeoR/GlpR family DNA-binding transcription regulator n=1 Tax=Pseudonocardia sp. MH-G8 TaxID=1854588 RepID=UPI001304459E|nr:DeoR/GlpR family DNA-binding transcription regulator [Pseudonocardia sp. MH-G8]